MRQQIIDLLENLNTINNGDLVQVNINEYVDKILEKAKFIEVSKFNKIVAFIAYYDNNLEHGIAYLTMLAVEPSSQNKGYGKHLLELSIRKIKAKGMKKYGLEVLKNNIHAINFYESQGFIFKTDRGKFLYMEKLL